MKYRKKPVVVEAEQFLPNPADVSSATPVLPGAMFMEFPVWIDARGPHLRIPTLEGEYRADPGDWIITGVMGEKYPCKPDVFAATYEPA